MRLPTIDRYGLAAAAVVLALAGCGGDDDPDGGLPPSSDPALAALVPDSISTDRAITIGVDPTNPPNESLDVDDITIVGWSVELFDAVAGRLGLTADWVEAPFGTINAGVQSGRYEVGISSFTINDERTAETTMVSYFNAGTQWAAAAGTAVDPDNACGLRVAVKQDTAQVGDLTARSEACLAAGQPEITIAQYQTQEEATGSVVAGENDAMLAGSPVSVHAVEQSGGELELAGGVYGEAPYGYLVSRDEPEFADALRQAVAVLIADGTYASILAQWGVEDGGITTPEVNP